MNPCAAAVLSTFLALPALAFPGVGGESAAPRTIKGTVQKTLSAGTYTYLLIKTAVGEEWAAVEKTALKKGDKAEVIESTVMENFDSPVLKRKFDKVVFGVLKGPGQGSAALGEPAAPPALPPAAVSRPKGPAAVVTVAELHKRRKELAGKLVRVAGKIVKANANIMGRNWFHIQDGSGSKTAGDNDLTLTTTGTAAVGSTVSAEGVLGADKDLGSGYAYKAILEDAELTPAD